jgi:hypothetical protein
MYLMIVRTFADVERNVVLRLNRMRNHGNAQASLGGSELADCFVVVQRSLEWAPS